MAPLCGLDIPVMHDDQHGTAIISGAALLNGLEVVNKKISEVKIVVLGAGASAISCASHYIRLGVKPENLIMCDSGGIMTKSSTAVYLTNSTFPVSGSTSTSQM